MQKLLTIVVPVYKVEKYISKCLDSLILPIKNMEKLEVIIVNDGTPDNSALVAKEYEKRYPNVFQVIDKENGGHGSAWNKGLELATGKYLRFLDSDDWLTNLDTFVDKLENVNVDMVFTNMVKFYQSTNKEKRYDVHGMKEGVIYDADLFDWQLTNQMLEPDALTNFQQCTYRTEKLKPHCPVFLEKQYYDDEILYVLPLIISNNFVFFDIVLYNYFIGREGQTVAPEVYAKGYKFKLKVRESVQEFVDKYHDMSLSKKNEIDFILNKRNSIIMNVISMMPYYEGKRTAKEFVQWLEKNHPNYVRSKRFKLYNISYALFWMVSKIYGKIVK